MALAGQVPLAREVSECESDDHGNTADPVFHRDFDYLDWIARLTSHIPEKGAQLVHYYGAYSNAHRGKAFRREAFALQNPEEGSSPRPEPTPEWLRERRRSWARLIRHIYEADPLMCRCGQRMRVVGFITQVPTIRKIQSPRRTAIRASETSGPRAAAVRRFRPRPVSKDLRTAVRRPLTLPNSFSDW
jgi:hypothetical protein